VTRAGVKLRHDSKSKKQKAKSKKPRNLYRNQGFINCNLERVMGIEPTELFFAPESLDSIGLLPN